MGHIDPATWTQLIIALATLLTAIGGWLKSQSNSNKLDKTQEQTTAIRTVTDGPLTAHLNALATTIDANAAEARSTAEAAKIQAATDVKASKESP